LEETPQGLIYLQKIVAIYVYTLSAATGAASRVKKTQDFAFLRDFESEKVVNKEL
jgi:hypothetical protein